MIKRIILLSLLATSAYAGPFAEVALSARQQLSQLPDCDITIENKPYKLNMWRMYDVNYTKNPYGSVMLGYQWNVSRYKVGIAVRHESSIATGKDRGINDIRLSLRWE